MIFKALLGKAGSLLLEPYRAINLSRRAVRKVKNYHSVGELSRDVRNNIVLLSEMINASVRGEYKGVTRKKLLLMLGAVMYFLLPFDVIPDYIPIMGYLDDASILIWVVNSLSKELKEFAAWKNSVSNVDDLTYGELYEMARRRDIAGRSSMSKAELQIALAVK